MELVSGKDGQHSQGMWEYLGICGNIYLPIFPKCQISTYPYSQSLKYTGNIGYIWEYDAARASNIIDLLAQSVNPQF